MIFTLYKEGFLKRLTFKLDTGYVLFEVRTKFLGAFAKFREATINFVMSVRLSAPSGRFFVEFDMRVFLEHLSGKYKSP